MLAVLMVGSGRPRGNKCKGATCRVAGLPARPVQMEVSNAILF